jgi:glycine/D-amino acid oxidase-like deaminating enzyme
MVDRADVVVIGSGGLGAATAFYLVQRGARNVVLVDKHDLGSQTSPRAAGMAAHARSSDLMVEVMKLAGEKLKRFTEDTGRPLSWTQSGSLKLARRPEDVEVLESELARARRHGLDAEIISAEAAHRLNPFVEPDGVLAALRVGEDLYFEPSQVAIGFARGAEAHGATLLPHTTVTGVEIEDGEVTAVETDRGVIRTPVVVDAAGAIGPAPAARGFFIAGGCNVAGLSASPAIGDPLAAWIMDGTPPLDLTPLSITRFRAEPASEEQLRQDAAWQYRHFYSSA